MQARLSVAPFLPRWMSITDDLGGPCAVSGEAIRTIEVRCRRLIMPVVKSGRAGTWLYQHRLRDM